MNVSREARRNRPTLGPASGHVTALGLVGVAALVLAGCGSPPGSPSAESAVAAVASEPTLDAKGAPAGLEHFRRWSDRISQGGQPQGEVAFRNLAALGFKTVLSVDGARPDAETAAKYGLRYVHVPFGYDGVPKDSQTRIVKAAMICEEPIYVHCHHGLHRGPAGAMFARIAVDRISNAEAVRELKESGCSEHYKGLYRDVLASVAPTAAELAAIPEDLPSYVSPGDLATQMASLDRTWGRMGSVKEASWTAPASMPDVDPPHEARILWEKIREIGRAGEAAKKGDEFIAALRTAEAQGHALEEALRKGDREAAAKSFAGVKSACAACHDRWRD